MTAATATTTNTQHPPYASASLYVGDLAPEVSEAILYEIFNKIGPVSSIRVCRDAVTRKSLGYAYVNYHSMIDAERSLDTLNYTPIKNVPCRLMWCHRDPSLRRSGMGNIFVKDLDRSIDNKALYDTFSLFGNILSCKVAIDECGKSRGYGFVHYETDEAAKEAIEKVNGMKIGAKTVYVGPFLKRNERNDPRNNRYTNLYIKSFPLEWTEQTVRELFAPFGEVTSVMVQTDSKGRRFGFVNFSDPDAAKEAVERLHDKKMSELQSKHPLGTLKAEEKGLSSQGVSGSASTETTKSGLDDNSSIGKQTNSTPEGTPKPSDEVDGKVEQTAKEAAMIKVDLDDIEQRFYVQRAMTKEERAALLREKYTASVANSTRATRKTEGSNLYVKNLDESISDEALREAFSKLGTVTSARVMKDDKGVSRGFGFVCFAYPEEATKAVTDMHLRIFHDKPLYVGVAEKKEQRIARLQHRYRVPRGGGSSSMMTGPLYPSGPFASMPPPLHQQQGPPYNSHHPMLMSNFTGGGGPTFAVPAAPHYSGGGAAPQQPSAAIYFGGAVPGAPRGLITGGGGGNSYQHTSGPGHAAMLGVGGGNMGPGPHPAPMPSTTSGANAPWRQQGGPLSGRSSQGQPGGVSTAHSSYPGYPLNPAGGGQSNMSMGGGAGIHNSSGPQNSMGPAGGSGRNGPIMVPRPRQQGGQSIPGGLQQNFKFTPQVRNRQDYQAQQQLPLLMPAEQQQMLSVNADVIMPQQLAAAPASVQKQMLGERLFPKVMKYEPELAGKITGMMLEMDNSELLGLLESEAQLKAKVEEAIGVLHRHQQGGPGGVILHMP